MSYQLKLIETLKFLPKEGASNIYYKSYPVCDDYHIEIDFNKGKINYGNSITLKNKTTSNFSQAENWVVLECVNRLLEKGYSPENIFLEKTYPSGHGHSGRLDICVNDKNGEYLLIECKTYGKEFELELSKTKTNGGQLFTYFKFESKAKFIMLYASKLNNEEKEVVYRNEIIEIKDDYRSGSVKDFYERWNKSTKDNGIFDNWVAPYKFISKALTLSDLVAIKEEDSSIIFNQFLEVLRHNVVSDKPNAFNKIFTLFLCKVYDEKSTKPNEELKFQWLANDGDVSFQLRLSDLYKNGMLEFLDKKVSDFSTEEFDKKYKNLDKNTKRRLRKDFFKLRLEKNNEFAIKEVFDNQSFKENAKIVKEVVELLQKYKLRYNKRQQYLSDFFEMLLTTGLKQESGQFFTPVPVAQFIIKSLPFDQLVDKKLANGEKDNLLPFVMDYAAGSGHFLTESMHEMQRLIDEKNPDYIEATSRKVKSWQNDHFDWAEQYVYGIEKDYRLVKVGKVGCYLHGDGLANVLLSDGLADFKHSEYKGLLEKTDGDFPQDNKQFDVVVSNPPYSISSFKNATTNYYGSDDFELYNALTDSSSEIECLFIERTKQLLKDGGIAGIILPSSILSNAGIYSKTREIILKYFKIIAITELGSNTFMATSTNTVVLFLKRRNNYQHQHIEEAVSKFFDNLQDVTINSIRNPINQYIQNAWEGINFDDYITLLQKSPNETIKNHELFQDYQAKIESKKDTLKEILKTEQEKLFYFILTYPQKVVLVKTGSKKAEKQFLGYEFSNRRGSEGLHPIQRNKSVAQCTQLFDEVVFDNPQKASTYIYQAFSGNLDNEIDESLKDNISRVNLVDLMSFDRVDFEKTISLSIKKKLKIESQWALEKIGEVIIEQPKSKIKVGTAKDVENGVHPFFTSGANILTFNSFLLDGKNIYLSTGGNAIVKYFDGKASYSTDTFVIKSFNENVVKTRFIFYFLDSIIISINEFYFKGVGLKHLQKPDFRNIKIPIPPKETQQKIIGKIEDLEQQEQCNLQEIVKLKESVKNIVKNISGKLTKLEKITSKIGSGTTPRGGEGSYQSNGISFIRSQNVYDNGLREKGLAFIDENQAKKLNNVIVKENDILFNITGASITRCCIVEEKYLPARVNQHVAIIRVKQESVITKYIQSILTSDTYKEKLLEIGEGATSRQAITKIQLEEFKIPVPLFQKQQKIVKEIEKIEAKINKLEVQINSIPQQKEQILKKYL